MPIFRTTVILTSMTVGLSASAAAQPNPPCPVGFDLQRTYATLNQPRGLYIRRMDADQRNDLVHVNFGQASITVLYQSAPGVFTLRGHQITTGSPWSADLADVDADGDLDAIVCWWDGFDVLRNNGNGFLSGRVPHEIPALMAAAGDLDADGDLDVVTSDFAGGRVMIATNNGSGAYSPAGEVVCGPRPMRVLLQDFDADGDLDIATNNQTSGTVSLIRNLGNLTFAPRITVSVGGATVPDITAADLDNDGRVDIGVTWQNDANLGRFVVVRNDGDFAFTALAPLLMSQGRPTWIETGDVDNDADTDVLISFWGSGSVQLLRNAGSGTFTASPVATGFSSANTVAIGDLDADADLDFACTAHETAMLRVYLNRGVAPRFAVHPVDTDVVAGQNFVLSADAAGSLPLTYQWYRDDVPLSNTGRVSGAATPALSIRRARPNDAGTYTLVASNACGPVTSEPGVLTVTVVCACDWNADSALDAADVFDFLEDFMAGDADFDLKNGTDSRDFFGFLRCYFDSCP
jgi:hypothetical protein